MAGNLTSDCHNHGLEMVGKKIILYVMYILVYSLIKG
jgi:hypothetical protein